MCRTDTVSLESISFSSYSGTRTEPDNDTVTCQVNKALHRRCFIILNGRLFPCEANTVVHERFRDLLFRRTLWTSWRRSSPSPVGPLQ